jgi:outer membrane protein OmpA-like peptidoglycan-associated protein
VKHSVFLGIGMAIAAAVGVPIERASALGRAPGPASAESLVSPVGAREDELRWVLERRDYYDIAVLDRRPLGDEVEACRRGVRYRLFVDRDGIPTRETRLGACDRGEGTRYGYRAAEEPTPRDRAEVRDLLERRDYRAIRIVAEERDGLVIAEACRNSRRFRLTVVLEKGAIAARERIGWCDYEPVYGYRPARIEDDVIDIDERASAQQCQDYLESLLERTAILFDFGSAELREENYPFLRRVARVLNRCPDAKVEVAGHTDDEGPRYVNRELSEDRARAVADFLARHGVSPRRLEAVGYGEEHPVASNESPVGRARNRRIEFVLDWQA